MTAAAETPLEAGVASTSTEQAEEEEVKDAGELTISNEKPDSTAEEDSANDSQPPSTQLLNAPVKSNNDNQNNENENQKGNSIPQIRTRQDEINIAYEDLEKMRRMNLEMECFEAGITDCKLDHCKTCLLAGTLDKKRFPRLQSLYDSASTAIAAESNSLSRFPRIQSLVDGTKTSVSNDSSSNSFPRIRRSLWGDSKSAPKEEPSKKEELSQNNVVLPRIQKMMDERQKANTQPCLICASPCCSTHSSSNFRKEGITVCLECERLFELDFIVDCVSTPDATERAKHIDHMIDCYDRCLLLLQYSAQYIDQIALSLEQNQEQRNKIGLGSSGVGAFSGVLGIAAAATILTPVGPPLLVASLLFGGGATAVQTGSEAMNYYSEPNQLADRILALHGMVLSLLRVTSTLRDAMLRDHIRTDVFDAEPMPLSEKAKATMEKNKGIVSAGANVGRSLTLGGAASLEVGTVAGAEVAAGAGARGATALSRAGTAAARTLRFARFAGGALSAAVLVMEANAIQSTLKEIQEGNPCEKANRIREIAKEINEGELPTTEALDDECQAYLNALASRPDPPLEVAAVAIDSSADDFPEAECKMAPTNGELCSPGAVIVDGEGSGLAAVPSEDLHHSSMGSSMGSSLFQRIQRHQERQRQAERADEVVAVVVEDEESQEAQLNLVL